MEINKVKFYDKSKKVIFPENPEFEKELIKEFPIENWNLVKIKWLKQKLQNLLFLYVKKTENINFFKGLQYEYGIEEKQDLSKAFSIYKDSALNSTDTLSMYRMYSIYGKEYKKFNIKKDRNLEKYFLFKTLAISDNQVYKGTNYFENKVELLSEITFHFQKEDETGEKFKELINYLSNNNDYLIKYDDLQLVYYLIASRYELEVIHWVNKFPIKDTYGKDELEIAYKTACYFMKSNLSTASKLFKICENEKYYRSYFDYCNFLYSEMKDIKEALRIAKEGYLNGNYKCYFCYYDIFFEINKFDTIFTGEKAQENCKELTKCLLYDIIYGNLFSIFEILYLRKILIKYNLRDYFDTVYLNEFKEIIDIVIEYQKQENLLPQIFQKNYCFPEINLDCGFIYFYGLNKSLSDNNVQKKDLDSSLICFQKSFDLTSSKSYMRFSYSYLYKVKKQLFLSKKINDKEYEESCKKVFNLYDSSLNEENEKNLSSSFFYYLARLVKNEIGTKHNDIVLYVYYNKAKNDSQKCLGTGSIISYYRKYKSTLKLEVQKKLMDDNFFKNIDKFDYCTCGDDDEISHNCCICYDSLRNTLLLPCFHLICYNCYNKLINKKCPLCRKCIIASFLIDKNTKKEL